MLIRADQRRRRAIGSEQSDLDVPVNEPDVVFSIINRTILKHND